MSTATHIKRWGPGLLLGTLALIGWWAALTTDTDTVSKTPVIYVENIETPVLSARRMPRSIQAPFADRALEPRINEAIQQTPGDSCVLVRAGNRVIGRQHNVDDLFVPASNQKVITTFVALDRLGPNFRFRTTVKSLAEVTDGRLAGDLYLVGSGDPFLTTDNWWTQYDSNEGRSRTRLEDLADAIVELGITEIEGSIIGDESLFDSERTGPWATRLIDSNQSGPLSALTVNEGFVDWPEKFPGSSAQRSPTDDPALHSATIFNQLLAERGIQTSDVGTGIAPEEAVVRAAVESPPLTDTITHVNSFSSNIGAELLLKQIGVQASGFGTAQDGIAGIEDTLEEFGIDNSESQLSVRDGSGLSEENRLTCSTLSGVLQAAGADSAFVDSFSIGGERGSLAANYLGTAAEGNVWAKTGTLNGVISLSGYIKPERNGGDSILFVFVANGPAIAADPNTRAARDALVLSIADYPEGPGLEELSPLPVKR